MHSVNGLKEHEARFLGKVGARLLHAPNNRATGLQNFDSRQQYTPGMQLPDWMKIEYSWVTEGFYKVFRENEEAVFSLLGKGVPELPVSANDHAYFSGMVVDIIEKYITGCSTSFQYLQEMTMVYYPNDVIEGDVTTEFVKK